MSLYEKVKSIIDELAENDCVIEYGNVYEAFMNAYVSESTKIPRFINSNIELNFVEHVGGEDQGSEYYSIYRFTDTISNETVFIKFEGWYASYVGSEYRHMFEVKPVEKTIIVYEQVT